jgi:3-dehydroquinate synthase
MAATIDKTVFVGKGAIRTLNTTLKKNKWSAYYIICDSNTLTHCLSSLIFSCPILEEAEIIELEPGEESKDISVITSIWETLAELGADKKSLVINLGGGVICDAGGFAAATFKRGVDFINIPTSLLAMADASIGGKNGINLKGIKNTIGTITQPNFVFVDPVFLETLPPEHLINGYAEIVKIALVCNKRFFNALSSLKLDGSFQNQEIVLESIRLKSQVVKKDPFDKGYRKILNFGHTIGHAVESLSMEKGKPLFHGSAVAIGMTIESHICLALKRITLKEFESILAALRMNFSFPVIEENDLSTLFRYMDQDKKNSGNNYMAALLKRIGKCDPAVKMLKAQVERSIKYYNNHIANAASL